MKYLPNILSSLRIVGAVALLLSNVSSIFFGVLLPILELPQWLWLWAGVIVAIKVVNQLVALVMYGRCCFPHTLANKATGFLLFIAVPMIVWSIIPISIAAIVATFAAIHEGCVLARAEGSARRPEGRSQSSHT